MSLSLSDLGPISKDQYLDKDDKDDKKKSKKKRRKPPAFGHRRLKNRLKQRLAEEAKKEKEGRGRRG